MNVGNSHILLLFDFLITRCCVYLRSKLSKFLPDVLAEPACFYFWRFLRRLELVSGVTPTIPVKKAEEREFQDCYCAGIGLCQAPSSRIDRPELTTIRNEPVTRIQPRPRANADARITALRGCESSSAARSSSSAKRRSSPGARQIRPGVDRFYPERLCHKAP